MAAAKKSYIEQFRNGLKQYLLIQALCDCFLEDYLVFNDAFAFVDIFINCQMPGHYFLWISVRNTVVHESC